MKKIRLWKMHNASQYEIDHFVHELSKLLLNGGDLIIDDKITLREVEINEGDEDLIVEIKQEGEQSIISVKKVELSNG
jgi:hypothetical protein